MNLTLIVFALIAIIFYLVITIAVPAAVAKTSFSPKKLSIPKYELDETFDSIISMTNDHSILQSLPEETAKEKKVQLRKIAADSTDIYTNKKQAIDDRYKQLLQRKEVLINFRNEIKTSL